jgi:hypothetical protein
MVWLQYATAFHLAELARESHVQLNIGADFRVLFYCSNNPVKVVLSRIPDQGGVSSQHRAKIMGEFRHVSRTKPRKRYS